jgi:hypothetical protein
VLWDRFLGLRVAMCVFLAWGCGGNVTGNGGADASSPSDAGGTAVDGSSDGPSVEGSRGAGVDADSGGCVISATSYDQSCNVDSDCVEVSVGDYCSATTCRCGTSAVNVGALAQFNTDVSKTPIGSGALHTPFCFCPYSAGPFCSQGTCQ